MTYIFTISEAELRFGEVLEKVRNGDSIVLDDKGTIIARIVPEISEIPTQSKVARLIGLLPSEKTDEEIQNEYHTFVEQKHS